MRVGYAEPVNILIFVSNLKYGKTDDAAEKMAALATTIPHWARPHLTHCMGQVLGLPYIPHL